MLDSTIRTHKVVRVMSHVNGSANKIQKLNVILVLQINLRGNIKKKSNIVHRCINKHLNHQILTILVK